jgi:hypothetical protein
LAVVRTLAKLRFVVLLALPLASGCAARPGAASPSPQPARPKTPAHAAAADSPESIGSTRNSRVALAMRSPGSVPLTFLAFICAATVKALREHPEMNARVLDSSYVLLRDVNLGVAVDTSGGLIVPSIKHADQLSLRGIAANIAGWLVLVVSWISVAGSIPSAE